MGLLGIIETFWGWKSKNACSHFFWYSSCYFTTYVWVWIFSEIGRKKYISFRKKILLAVNLIYRLVVNSILKVFSKSCSRDYELSSECFFMVLLCSNKKLWASKKVWLAYRTPLREWMSLIWASSKVISRQTSKGDIPKTFVTNRTNLRDNFELNSNLIQSHLRRHLRF
jgi:hypothetical protein